MSLYDFLLQKYCFFMRYANNKLKKVNDLLFLKLFHLLSCYRIRLSVAEDEELAVLDELMGYR